jgi:hypothetical protein
MNEKERQYYYEMMNKHLKEKNFYQYFLTVENYLKREQEVLLNKIPKKLKKGTMNVAINN